MRRPQCLRSRVGSIRSLHGPTGEDHGRVWAAEGAAGSLGGCASCPLAGGATSRNHPVREARGCVRPRART
ncbi:hypothetical protein C9J60_08785 [Streptomyces sp. A244]|nr:hypothetical protein C9J60_08785 [Streptomyces sp. A244]